MKRQQQQKINWRGIITIVKTYQIKISYKGEVISDVVHLCRSIADTVAAIYKDKLPEDFSQQIITVSQQPA